MPRLLREMIILGVTAFAGLYLILPSLIPDFIPVIGWIDEGMATLIIINTLNYYGINLTNLYGDKTVKKVVRRRIIDGKVVEETIVDSDGEPMIIVSPEDEKYRDNQGH